MRVLVIRHNSDGRPRGWGLAHYHAGDRDTTPSDLRKDAEAEAERQYAAHSCYPGEERGRLTVYWFDAAEDQR